MSEKKKRAVIKISPELIADWLCLSDDTIIVGSHYDRPADAIVLHLCGDGLPDSCLVNSIDPAPMITPTYRRKEHELVSLGESK